MTTVGSCEICGQIAGDRTRNGILRLIRADWSVRPVLDEVPGAVVMPSIGALVAGHVLVCPTDHARSVVATAPRIQGALAALEATTAARLGAALDKPMHRFEHGSSRNGDRVACSVEHAHRHLVPADVDIRSALARAADWREVGASVDDLRAAAGDDEYLAYNAPTGECWLATTRTGFASQLLRRILADEIGIAEWNWRQNPASERIRATVAVFRANVAENMLAGAC